MNKTIKFVIATTLIMLMLFSGTVYAGEGAGEAISTDGKIIYYIRYPGSEVTIDFNGERLDFGRELDWIARDYMLTSPETLVPIREVCEKLGYVVGWDEIERTISITDPGTGETTYIEPQNRPRIVNIDCRYYMDFTELMNKLNLKSEGRYSNTLSIYKVMPLTAKEKANVAPIQAAYPTGIYKVGVDIPEGEYLLRTNGSAGACLLSTHKLSAAPHTMTRLLEEPTGWSTGTPFLRQVKGNVKIFQNTYIIKLSEGEFVELVDCTAALLANEPPLPNGYAPYGTGAYRVGVDIPQGDYVLMKNGDAPHYSRGVMSPTTFGAEWEGTFSYEHTIISLQNGNRLYIEDCAMYPIGNAPRLTAKENILTNGMFKVGVHLSAGAYLVVPDGSGKKAQVTGGGYSQETIGNEGRRVFLEDGESLYLENAILDVNTWQNYKKTTYMNRGTGCFDGTYSIWQMIEEGTEPIFEVVDEESAA